MNKILITEDDPFVARIYQSKFQAEGFEVSMAGDGREAIRQLAANTPDVVLLDLMLPRVNGVEVLKFIRSNDALRDVPVVVLSSAVAGELVEAARNAGATRVLSKALCSPRHAVDEVRNVLAARIPQPAGGDYEFDVRVAFQSRVPPLIAELQPRLQHLLKSGPASHGSALLELGHAAHTLASHATLAGFSNIARMASSLEVLLYELDTNPRKVTQSTLRTVGQVVDFMPELLRQDGSPDAEPSSPLILVLDDDAISGQAVCNALERANLRALAFEDPLLALRVMEKNRFDLIFLDVDMPRMSGLDICQKLRATPLNAATPVVLVTGFDDFETRDRSEVVGATDFIAKPIVMIELAVKAVLHLLRGQADRKAGARSEERHARAA
ncbi:MAG TPA: response regulator [Thermoanaerobaculia bacterium]|nr:response regulator [Thermoanaerobaculia bacterium]